MSLDEWGEYIVYGGEEVKIGRSYRIYDDRGELVSTGMEWETIKRTEGMSLDAEIEKARGRIRERLEKKRREVEEKYGRRSGGGMIQ
jgi:hypothetical protein